MACESKAVSHCSSVIESGAWKKKGSSGRALLTKMSRLPNSALTRSTMRLISSGRVTSAWTTRPSAPRSRIRARVWLAAVAFW